jgi:hypothetical protein
VLGPSDRPPGRTPSGSISDEPVRLSLVLTQEDYARLKRAADELHLKVGEVLQRSIATALFLQDQIDAGSKILIQDRNGNLREFVLPGSPTLA